MYSRTPNEKKTPVLLRLFRGNKFKKNTIYTGNPYYNETKKVFSINKSRCTDFFEDFAPNVLRDLETVFPVSNDYNLNISNRAMVVVIR